MNRVGKRHCVIAIVSSLKPHRRPILYGYGKSCLARSRWGIQLVGRFSPSPANTSFIPTSVIANKGTNGVCGARANRGTEKSARDSRERSIRAKGLGSRPRGTNGVVARPQLILARDHELPCIRARRHYPSIPP